MVSHQPSLEPVNLNLTSRCSPIAWKNQVAGHVKRAARIALFSGNIDRLCRQMKDDFHAIEKCVT
jgi:hypothetical protein